MIHPDVQALQIAREYQSLYPGDWFTAKQVGIHPRRLSALARDGWFDLKVVEGRHPNLYRFHPDARRSPGFGAFT